jgi:uncharacterized protein YndB with AHSA1/START domain
MVDPLVLSFEVACPPDRAFALWTTRISTWWPPDHTVTGRDDVTVVLEPGVGGRIFERTPDGGEHDWGEVTVWEPPDRLDYLWHLRRDRADATEVSVRFVPSGHQGTLVEIKHTGWDRLGTGAAEWRGRNEVGWRTLLPHYLTATGTAGPGHLTTTKEDRS